MPERASFHSPGAFYATWAHEQVHSTGHASRLKRNLGGAFGKPCYAREELVAELRAVLLGDRLEIGSELQSNAACLEHWIALLQAEPQVLIQVLGEARHAVELIAPDEALHSGLEEPLESYEAVGRSHGHRTTELACREGYEFP